MNRGHYLLVAALLVHFLMPMTVTAKDQQTSSCIRCHMAQDDQQLARPVTAWQRSVHAANGISCPDCHGGDGTLDDEDEAMDPARGFVGAPTSLEIPTFCGKCHLGVAEDYRASAHGQALGSGGPQCITCHGSHDIIQPSPPLINPEKCTRCHSFERARTIRDALIGTDNYIVALEADLQALQRWGIAVKTQKAEVFAARNTFHRLFHTVDVQKVRHETTAIQTRLDHIQQEVKQIEDRLTRRQWAGAVIVGLLGLVALLFFYLRHTYRQEERREEQN